MTATNASVAGRQIARALDTGAERWLRSMRLQQVFGRADGFRAREVRTGTIRLDWTALERTAGHLPVSVEVSVETGAVTSERPFAHWSEPPTARSHVVVVPDILTFLTFRQACDGESVFPFVFVAPVAGDAVPPDWLDPRYWNFEAVTVLSDKLSAPSPLVIALADRDVLNMGVVTPAGANTWRAWALNRRLGYRDLAALESQALPVTAYSGIRYQQADAVASLRRRCRELDDEGRLCRLVDGDARVGGAADGDVDATLIRSDRTYARVRPWQRRSVGTNPPPLVHRSARETPWGSGALVSFIDGGASPSSVELGQRLFELLVPAVAGDAGAARILATYVALTYVHPALDELPLLVVRGGHAAARLALRRLLAAIVFEPTVVTRNRAIQLARVADAGTGVLIMEEPGPVCGPSGATELGRFLECSLIRDGSSYTSISGTRGLRALDVFGPRIIIAGRQASAGLACATIEVDLPAISPAGVGSSADHAAARDALYAWSMHAFERLRTACADVPVDHVMAAVRRELYGVVAASPAADVKPSPVRSTAADPSPRQVMDEVMSASGSGGYLSMVQVMLEIALRGADGASLTPERVGRWITSHPTIDAERSTERRRLYGQISRIYPLASAAAPPGDPGAAFEFCTRRACGECRYDAVCGSTFPGMRDRKMLI